MSCFLIVHNPQSGPTIIKLGACLFWAGEMQKGNYFYINQALIDNIKRVAARWTDAQGPPLR